MSPSEVVRLGELHLGLSREEVVTAANELLGERSRTEEALTELWLSLVDVHEVPTEAAVPVAHPEIVREATQSISPEPEPTISSDAADNPPADDEIDVHDLVDAPSQTDQLIERLTEAFPGAELHSTDHLEDDR